MHCEKTKIKDCMVIKPEPHKDDRGVFFELYNARLYLDCIPNEWRQMNCSVSHEGVMRGIHIVPFAKLISCLHGYVIDVVVDMRKDSPSYLQWIFVDLMGSDYPTQVYVPPGCGHGFLSVKDNSVITYMQTGCYNPEVESSVNWRDPKIGIKWPQGYKYILSPKDEAAPFL